MGSFRLDPESAPDNAVPQPSCEEGLTSSVLLLNARWFTQIRWMVVAVLTGFGAADLFLDPKFLGSLGLTPPGLWPLGLAGTLTVLNLGVIRWIGNLSRRTQCPWRRIAANIWFQIATDLIVLTVLVYRIGPTSTVVAFSYLFHITLACIFFGRRDSFVVTLLSAILFMTVVIAQDTGLIAHAGILASEAANTPDILAGLLFAVPTVFVWLVVWYLVSSISDAMRRRDCDLDAANKRLVLADQETNLQMLRVTHDLKAPFSGIESNIQVLKHSHWNETPEAVRQIIGKIDARAVSLRARIGDILTLGSLRSKQEGEQTGQPVQLREMLNAILLDVHDLAASKRVSVVIPTGETTVSSDPKQLKVLFSNLISNAIVYSRDGGTVDIGIDVEAPQVRVCVSDHGIGVGAGSLPHIFEDFFRAQEAAAVNPNSTGLGLAIVRQIARNLRLTIDVESEEGKRTAFTVSIPAG